MKYIIWSIIALAVISFLFATGLTYSKGINLPNDYGKIVRGMSVYDLEKSYDIKSVDVPIKSEKIIEGSKVYIFCNNSWHSISIFHLDIDGKVDGITEENGYDGPFHMFLALRNTSMSVSHK